MALLGQSLQVVCHWAGREVRFWTGGVQTFFKIVRTAFDPKWQVANGCHSAAFRAKRTWPDFPLARFDPLPTSRTSAHCDSSIAPGAAYDI